MKGLRKILAFTLVLAIVFSGVWVRTPAVQAATNYVTVDKTVSPTAITTLEEAEVRLAIKAAPPVSVVMPNDVILIIDKSGSMSTENKITDAKNAAKAFVDLMDLSKHRVGVVDYSSYDMVNTFDLTTDGTAAKSYIDKIVAKGSTDTGKAVESAAQLLVNHRPEAQPVIVIMTDGAANVGPNGENGEAIGFQYAKDAAKAAKELGIVFYTIALLNANDNPGTSAPNLVLKEMATTAQHHHFVLGSVGLEEIYKRIVQEIGRASAYDVTVTDIVAPEFEIVPGSTDNNIPKPTINDNTLTWTFHELKDQELVFTYKIRHKEGKRIGDLFISSSTQVKYKDYAGAQLTTSPVIPYLNVRYPAPIIESVTPDNGLTAGGETVLITGRYFRPGVTVSFGGNSSPNTQYIDSQNIKAIVPPGKQGNVSLTVANDDRQFVTAQYRYWANPVVDSISPSSGLVDGGLRVTIHGNYFMDGIKVKFGDKAASAVTVASQNGIYATTPSVTSPGPVDVVLENPDGTSIVVKDGFTYILPPEPIISSIVPNSGLITGGDPAIIYGKNFTAGSKVYFDTVEVSISNISGTGIEIKTPAMENEGPVDVIVKDIYGQTATLPDGFTYKKPEIPSPKVTGVSPSTGYITGGQYVYITGVHFASDSKVLFGLIEVPVNYFVGAEKIRVVTPAVSVPQIVDITVINKDGLTGTLEKAFSYVEPPLPPAPSLIKISPASGYTTGGEIATVIGANFTDHMKVFFGSSEATVTTWTETSITVKSPTAAAPGPVDIIVTDTHGQSASLKGAYTYIEKPKPIPSITAVKPNSGYITGGEPVYLEGVNFTADMKVIFGTAEISVDYFLGPEKVRVKSPAVSAAETVDITVVSADGLSSTLKAAFGYKELPPPPGPTITSVGPNSGYVLGGDYVFIVGTNFAADSKVYFGTIEVPIDYFLGPEKIRVKVPPVNTPQSVSVKVVNKDGQSAELANAYTYKAIIPQITLISPNNGLVTGKNAVYISGQNILPGAKVFFGSTEVAIDYYFDSTRIRVIAPVAAVTGAVDVKVVLVNGAECTVTAGYTYNPLPPEPAPTITSISPNNGPMAGGTLVYINGTNFKVDSKVFVGSIEVPVDYYVGAEKIRIKTPALSTSGTVDIKVINPDGQAVVKTGAYTYNEPPQAPPPVITTVSPNNANTTGGSNVYINGTGFTSETKIFFGSIEVPMNYFVGPEKLLVKSPVVSATMAGTTVDVKVINADGKSATLSGAFTFK